MVHNNSLPAQSTPILEIDPVDSSQIVWHDPRVEPFEISGFAWMEQDHAYRRLPLKTKHRLTPNVDELANHTAGGQIRFRTNSDNVLIKVELLRVSDMHAMSPVGQSGFDIYLERNGVLTYLHSAEFSADSIQYETQLFNAWESDEEVNSFVINMPLFNGVKNVAVGLDPLAEILPPPAYDDDRRIILYGTSICQGGCVSRPGALYSNQLARSLNLEVVNLGFSGSAKGEPEIAHLINEITKPGVIVIDYEANHNDSIHLNLNEFVDIIRGSQPNTPVLIVSKIRYAWEVEGDGSYELLLQNRDFMQAMVLDRQKEGDGHIYFLDGSTILGPDFSECTVDGVHPNDLGSNRLFLALDQKLNEIGL